MSPYLSCSCSVTKLCPTLCNPVDCSTQASLSFTISRNLFRFMSFESVMLSNISSSAALFSFCLESFQHRKVSWLFSISSELALHIKWPKYWSFSFSISPSNEYSELISFRIDWFDLLAVQGILKHLLQHHNSKESILQHLVFFMVQFSHLYMTTKKNHSFDCMDICRQSDVSAF